MLRWRYLLLADRVKPLLKQSGELLLLGCSQLGQLGWWVEQSVARSLEGGHATSEHHGLDAAIGL